METVSATERLIILPHADYLRLKRDLKATGIDLCYTARISRPVRVPWSPLLFQDEILLNHIARHRPADSSYRLVSVRMTKRGGWVRLDEYTVAFHAVGSHQNAELEKYLQDHNLHTLAELSRDMVDNL
jgi:hypothetical protein